MSTVGGERPLQVCELQEVKDRFGLLCKDCHSDPLQSLASRDSGP